MSRIVYVNGEYTAEETAKISIFDRGFIFGDGVYEVVPVVTGKLVDRAYFLERLDRSLSELSITWPCSQREYLDIMQELISRNALQEVELSILFPCSLTVQTPSSATCRTMPLS